MEIIEMLNLDFVFDEELFYQQIRMDASSKRAVPIDRILKVAKNIPKPKVLYGVLEAEIIDEDCFTLEEINFCSKVGVKKINKSKYVIPNIVTSGFEIEEYCMIQTNILEQYITMELCNFSCDYARQVMEKDLKERYDIVANDYLYPGEEELTFESGKNIFNLFNDVKEKMGVSISETGTLSPSRTVYSLCFGEKLNK